jgi:hypothetical protein
MAGRRINGGIIGVVNSTSNTSAKGVWSFTEQVLSRKGGNWPRPPPPLPIDFFVIAGGGSGGGTNGGTMGGGGGAGGYRTSSGTSGGESILEEVDLLNSYNMLPWKPITQ